MAEKNISKIPQRNDTDVQSDGRPNLHLSSNRTMQSSNPNRGNKHTESQAQDHEAQLRDQTELLDLLHDSIIIHDLSGKITFWNQGSEQLYGWKRQEVLGKIMQDVLHTSVREPLMQIIAKVCTSGKWEGELVNTSKDNETLVVESRWALRRNAAGQPTAIIEIDRDITRRKENEQIAREALEYAESIIETVSDALIVLTPELKVASANHKFYQMFGLEADDVLEKSFDELGSHQWDIAELHKLLCDILPNNSSIEEYVMEYNSFHTGRRVLHLNARQIVQHHQRTHLILLAIRDISARRQQEEALKEMTEHLLLSEELQRQQIATALHETVGQILAISKRQLIAMERNAPTQMQESLRAVVQSINEAIEQSRRLTLDLSSPTLNTFGLEAGIEELADLFTQNSGIQCNVQASDEPKPLEKKVQLLLYRSVKKLLENTKEHAAAAHVGIKIERLPGTIVITVRDDGRGFDTVSLINPAFAEKGFGLYSISQRLKNIGGTFKINSEIGKGTIIILQAPLYQGAN